MPHRQPSPAHLSISYERLRDLARRAGHTQTAEWLPIEAGDTRRVLCRQRPGRVDLAEELATTLSQLDEVVEASAGAALTAEAVGILESFERASAITPKGATGQFGELCVGESGAVTRIRHARQQRVVDGLPSYSAAGADGSCDPAVIGEGAAGPHDVAFADGVLLFPLGLDHSAAGRDAMAQSVPVVKGLGTLMRARPFGRDQIAADVAAYQVGPSSNPYSIATKYGTYTVESDQSITIATPHDEHHRDRLAAMVLVRPTR